MNPFTQLNLNTRLWYAVLSVFASLCLCHADDQAANALKEARQLSGQEKYEEALQKYVWFHEHALEIDPSYSGVRLSFALADWVQLGEKYPKALDTLREIRNTKTSLLLSDKDEFSLFLDVAAINQYLDDSKATVELFKKVAATRPGFATSVYPLAEDALVGAGEFPLARKYMGDPKFQFAEAKQRFE